MSAGQNNKGVKSATHIDLMAIFRDQYSCTECNSVPEIKNIDYNEGTIKFECPNDGKKSINIEEYLEKEIKQLNYNVKCEDGKLDQCKKIEEVFNYCTTCKNYYCLPHAKSHIKHKDKLIKVNELNNKCQKHFENFNKYCLDCKKHFCSKCKINCGHNNIKEITKANEVLEKLKENKSNLEKKKKEIERMNNIFEKKKKKIDEIKIQLDKLVENLKKEEKIIKLWDILIQTYEKHPSNYFHSINIQNVAKINYDFNYEKINFNDENIIQNEIIHDDQRIDNRLKLLEKKIKDFLTMKLKVDFDGTNINLSGKNIDDSDFNLLCCIPLANATEINLSHNKIQDLSPIEYLKAPNATKLDLSYNVINNINPIKNLKLKEVFPILKEIKLDHNNVFEKDIEYIRGLLKIQFIKECELEYELDKSAKQIRIFGKDFFDKNKSNCKIKYNDKNDVIDIEEFYKYDKYEEKHKNLKVTLYMTKDISNIRGIFNNCSTLKNIETIFDINSTSNIIDISELFSGCKSLKTLPNTISNWDTSKIVDMSGIFYECQLLESLPDISKWNTENVTNMMSIFNRCTSLKKLPDISKWKTGNVKDMSNMFINCSSLKEIPSGISDWDISNVEKMKKMFKGCKNLARPDLEKWKRKKQFNEDELFN